VNPALTEPAPQPTKSFKPIDAEWRQWIAENRLRQCTPESMVATMAASGLDPTQCAQAIAAMELDPAYRAALKHQQLQRKLESVLGNLQKLWQSDPAYQQVEKRAGVSKDEFVARYVRGCRPVVLTDLARDWPAMRRWSPQDLKARFGHLDVEIQAERNADPQYEQNKLQLHRVARLSVFVDQVLAGGPTNDYYMTANNEVLRRPEFAPLLADIGTLPPYCDAAQLSRLSSFWFGPAGTVTSLHHDTLMLLHTQIVGRKRWRFVSPLETPKLYNHNGVFSPIDVERPDLARYPLFAQAHVLEVIVEPGETVFLPLAWWHQVTSLDVSLSFSYSNLAVPNQFDYENPSILNW
jgi:Cupin-like domain